MAIEQTSPSKAWRLGDRLDGEYCAAAAYLANPPPDAPTGTVVSFSVQLEPVGDDAPPWERERDAVLANRAGVEATKGRLILSIAVDNSRGFGKRSRYGFCALSDEVTFWMVPQVREGRSPATTARTGWGGPRGVNTVDPATVFTKNR